jgi:hypothetical protein
VEQVTVKIVGTSPLMMHNGRLVNPLDPIVKEMKKITSKTKKTEEDYDQLARLEFIGGMYYDTKIGPYIPANCLWATIRAGARFQKKGPAVERGLMMVDVMNRLEYTGTRKSTEMYDAGFADIRNAKPPGSSGQIMRCRPKFDPPWAVSFSLMFDAAQMSSDELRYWAEQAGLLNGLCDGRKGLGMGRFIVEEWVTI